MSYKKKVLNFTLFSGLSTYLESFVGLLLSVFIARSLGAENFGRYSVLLLIASIGVAFANGGLKTAVIKFLAEARGKDQAGVALSVFRYVLKIQMMFIPATLIFMVVGVYLYFDFGKDTYSGLVIGLVVLAVIPKSLQMFYVSVAKGMEAFKAIFLINAVVTPINLLAVLIAALLDGGLTGFVSAYAFVSIVYFAASRYWVKREMEGLAHKPEPMPEEFRRRLNRFALLSTMNHVLLFIVGREIEVLFLNAFGMTEEAGLYKVGFNLAETAIILVPGIFGAVLLPVMAKSLGQSVDVQAHRFRESARFMIMLAAPIIVFGIVFADVIIEILYGPEFRRAAVVLRVLLAFFGFTMLNQVCASILLSHDRQGTVMKVVMITASVNIVLDFLLIKYFGLGGAVAAAVLAKLSHALIYQYLVSGILRTQLTYGGFVHTYFLALVAILPVWLVHRLLPGAPVLLAGIPVFFATYVILLLLQFKITYPELAIFRDALEHYPLMRRFFDSGFFRWIDRRYTQRFGGEMA